MTGDSDFLEVRGRRLEYAWHGPPPGAAPTLVLLHQGLGCVATWKEFPGRLAAATGLGVFVFSRLGYGASDPCDLPRPLDYMEREALEWLPGVLDAAGVESCALIGHSDGGSIAIVYAGAVRDRRLRALVLEAPHVFVEDISVASIAEAKAEYDSGDLRERVARRHGRNADIAFRGWNDAWLDPGFRSWNIERYLAAIRVPALVIQGRDDQYGTAAQVGAIASGSGAKVEVVMLDDCRHSAHRDQEDKVIGAIAPFVARNLGSAR